MRRCAGFALLILLVVMVVVVVVVLLLLVVVVVVVLLLLHWWWCYIGRAGVSGVHAADGARGAQVPVSTRAAPPPKKKDALGSEEEAKLMRGEEHIRTALP